VVTRVITIIGFVCVLSALFTLEFLAHRKNSRIPTMGEFLGYLMRSRAGRVLVLLGWLWLGWHYFAR
jgi:hypothetical protein